ncbi:MAG: periplasmic heavy metal sensor [Acidobacteriota bacterium]
MKIKLMCLALFLFFNWQSAYAQQPAGDPFDENFFAPELVMQHQQAIGLSEEQKNFFKTEFRKAQTQFTELQWQLQDELEKLVTLIKQENVNEQTTLAQLDKVLSIEQAIKRAQTALLIKVKNHLTTEQRAQLKQLKGKGKAKPKPE